MAGAGIVFRAGTPGDDITLAGTGTYSYTGQTQLFSNGASIILGANDKLPVGFPVYFGNGGTTVFDLNGFDQQLAGVFGNAIGIQATITNNGTSPSVLTTNVPALTTYTYLGGITDGDDQTEPFVQTVSLVKTGEGTQILSDFNSYTGTTTVNGGTLVINGDQSSATGAVQVSAATLAGTGTVGGAVTIAAAGVEAAGTINPGPVGAIGTLNVPDTTIAGILACDISATSSDLLAVNGDLILTGATLAVNPLATPTGAAYTLATYTTLTGTFSAATLPAGYTLDYTTPGEIRLVQATGGYDAWVIDNNVTGGPNGDDDKDGISNLVEYALGFDPQVGDPAPGTFVGNVLTYTKGSEAKTAGDVTYIIETSTSLQVGSWTTAVVATPEANSISYTLPANQPGGKLFARLKVVK